MQRFIDRVSLVATCWSSPPPVFARWRHTWDCHWPAPLRIMAWRAVAPESPIGTRRALRAHLDHTVGADAVLGVLARAARAQPGGALVEWRNPAACAHGRLRPDGYGVLRLGRRDYGFFLEFDRGTVRPAPLRAKFGAYHRYFASARAARDFDGPPSILVVTVGAAAEDRVVDAVL